MSNSDQESGADPANTTARPRTVLVVDDNEINRIVCCGLMESLGYGCRTADDGLEAIEKSYRRAPKLVLMDVDMPVLDGLQAARCLKALQRTGDLPPFPIIAVTADDDARDACSRVGMDGFLTKPLVRAQLQAELLRVGLKA